MTLTTFYLIIADDNKNKTTLFSSHRRSVKRFSTNHIAGHMTFSRDLQFAFASYHNNHRILIYDEVRFKQPNPLENMDPTFITFNIINAHNQKHIVRKVCRVNTADNILHTIRQHRFDIDDVKGFMFANELVSSRNY